MNELHFVTFSYHMLPCTEIMWEHNVAARRGVPCHWFPARPVGRGRGEGGSGAQLQDGQSPGATPAEIL